MYNIKRETYLPRRNKIYTQFLTDTTVVIDRELFPPVTITTRRHSWRGAGVRTEPTERHWQDRLTRWRGGARGYMWWAGVRPGRAVWGNAGSIEPVNEYCRRGARVMRKRTRPETTKGCKPSYREVVRGWWMVYSAFVYHRNPEIGRDPRTTVSQLPATSM